MIDYFQKKYYNHILKPYLIWYLKKERITKLKGFTLLVKPTVFHPKFFFSSLYFYDVINKLALENKSVLEIGCGSGLLSLLAYKKKAIVTCCDINDKAIECTQHNFKLNFNTHNTNFNTIKSDLFDAIPKQTFDFIFINPPYFFSDVYTENQLAWNCGKNGEYFIKFFSQLNNYINTQSTVLMILADNCEIERIQTIAKQYHFLLKMEEEKKIKWEINYIFKIVSFD